MGLDKIDQLSANAFEGYIVRKDLLEQFRKTYPVPTYVIEFLLGRYCATIIENEIQEGLEIVKRQLQARTVRPGEEEYFKSKAEKEGVVKLIDIITAKLDADSGSYLAYLPSLRLNKVRIPSEVVYENDRMLTGGFYAEIELEYDAAIALENNGRPFGIKNIRPIQLSQRDVLQVLYKGREHFTLEEWKDFLIRSVGMEPSLLSEKAKNVLFVRMIPFVERNYNLIELGPRGTGKSHLYQQISPYSHLISGGKATVAKMFVNMGNGERGLVCKYDVICFDEVSGVSFDQKDGVNIMKGYMESGEFSRGKEPIRADGGIVMVGNFDVDVEHQQRISHLFGPMPKEMRDDTAFMDRIHAFVPGWDFPKLNKTYFTNHFGLVSDFLAECWTRLRDISRISTVLQRIDYGGALSGRDTTAVNKTINGLLKLMQPNPEAPVADELLEWAVKIALEYRRRVKEQQKRIGSAEFRNTHFSYRIGEDGVETFVTTPEIHSENTISEDPLPPGQIWALNAGGQDDTTGLYKIEINAGPGSGVKILNKPVPPQFQESVRYAEQNLYSKNKELIGDRDARMNEFSIQLRSFDASKSGNGMGMAVLIGMCSAILEKNTKGGLILVGQLNLGGSLDMVYNAVNLAEIAVEKGATTLLVPLNARKQLNELSDEMITKINIQYYIDLKDCLIKALLD
ncbi:BREX system Lon protease-like protein BrxL [Chitinophaga sancti]|uniref:ATP-dependent Lon protease n=1 Tax=Chitinophaga sancti TaxID=1004 RepID=A0A1K1T1E8_9BACT|nr:BREX system Lon protease-like protein BrxL [Chitinophaga sancti]WQD61005.1 BREX system Lon protease-like protein BrxL [Chitinophaga sancti]WQG86868.1 BREX system Lon protease-like protein BrxL [Chitinophaga sancti]SFW90394.1 ATP-dependent Lon protease [Chitinophaga sancti]